MKRLKTVAVVAVVTLLAACTTVPDHLFASSPEILEQRQLQTRRYEGIGEEALVIACANVLQDLGFNLENSEVKLGVITANKQRDATNAGEVVAAVFLAMLGAYMPTSKDQTFRVSLIVRPASSNGKSANDSEFVRVSFQRIVRRSDNSIYVETLKDADLYRDFYDRVSKSIFLEAQKI